MTDSSVIAIDGPSGAGKGTVARALASALECRHVDTGAMYRAVAWKAAHEGRPLDDDAAVTDLAQHAHFTLDGARVVIDGHDVTDLIRTPEMDAAAAKVARLAGVRAALVAQQRALARAARVVIVMEGRDIGTAVFPDAVVKIYLDAAPEERAVRRAHDPAHQHSQGAGIEEVANALEARDHLDRTRRASPLKQASDAVLIDTTGVAIDEVVARLVRVVRDKLEAAP